MCRLFFFLLFFCNTFAKPSLEKSFAQVAQEYRRLESKVASLEDDLTELEKKIQDKTEMLNNQYLLTNRLLATLYQFKKNLPAHMISQLKNPELAIHSTIILNQYARSLYDQLKKISIEIKALETSRHSLIKKTQDLKKESEPLRKKKAELEKMIQDHAKKRKSTTKNYEKIIHQSKSLALKSSSLKDLIEKTTPPPKTQGSFVTGYNPNPKCKYTINPAQGKIVSHFEETHPFNLQGKGVVFSTKPKEFILAPLTGRIVYAGPFRLYKNIVIIAHNKNYHTILTNLAQLEVISEDWIRAGEPIGRMGSDQDKNFLYLELRKNGIPTDPQSWLP